MTDCKLDLPIGGIVPMTTIDFPGKISLVVFTQGCPWKCPYCHNRSMRSFANKTSMSWEEIFQMLKERRDFLDAVVFSGGEPTYHDALAEAMEQIREEDFSIGLHTAGIYPEKLKRILPLVNWIGFDVKAPLDHRYDLITGMKNSAEKVRRSLKIVQKAGVDFQIRTTVDNALLSSQDIQCLGEQLRAMNAPEPVFQPVRHPQPHFAYDS